VAKGPLLEAKGSSSCMLPCGHHDRSAVVLDLLPAMYGTVSSRCASNCPQTFGVRSFMRTPNEKRLDEEPFDEKDRDEEARMGDEEAIRREER
jgi:hypothetical protein